MRVLLRTIRMHILCSLLFVPVCMYAELDFRPISGENIHEPRYDSESKGLSALNPPSNESRRMRFEPPPPHHPQYQHEDSPRTEHADHRTPMSSERHNFERDHMEDHDSYRTQDLRQEPDHDEQKHISTNVSSGLDVNFKEQEHIDHAVDTINAKSGGNWLLKRVWWEKTEDVYEQIKEVFNKVMDTRMRFISEYNKLNRALDIFYSEIGIEQGPLQDLLSHAQDLMQKEEKEQGYLDKKEQAFVKKLKGKEREVEQIKLDVKAIQELDSKLDEAFEVLFKQIDVCNQYEQKAWNNFKEIARELNDKEARKLYYDTEGLYKDIQKVSEYISGAFATYFNQTIQSAHDHTTKISSQMNSLKHEGVNLVKEAEILEKDEEPAPKKIVKKVERKNIKKGWWYSLGESFGKFIDHIINLLPKSVQQWFGKEITKAEKEYDQLKQEGEKEYEHLKKEGQSDYQKAKKYTENAMHYAEGETHKVGHSIDPHNKTVVHHPENIHHTVAKKPLDAVHAPTSFSKPLSHMPTPPSVLHTKEKHDPTVAHVDHRPVHTTAPRRSITDHFEPEHAKKYHDKETSKTAQW